MTTHWTEPTHGQRIVAPALAGRKRLHDLGGQQCLIEYNDATGRFLRRQVILVDARNATRSVLVRAYTVGSPKTATAEYSVHRMAAITGPDQVRRDPVDHFRHFFGIVIE